MSIFLSCGGCFIGENCAIVCVVGAPLLGIVRLAQHTGLMSVGLCPVGSKKIKVFFFLVAAAQK